MDVEANPARGALDYAVAWGDIPAWVSAIATLLALVAAAWAGYTAKMLYDRESHRDEQARLAVRQGQARHVAVWLDLDERPDAPQELALHIRNGSDEPVYNVDVTLLVRDTDGNLQAILPRVGLATLPPSDHARVLDLPPPALITARTPSRPGVCVSITFQDAAGVRWQRNHVGQLAEYPAQAP